MADDEKGQASFSEQIHFSKRCECVSILFSAPNDTCFWYELGEQKWAIVNIPQSTNRVFLGYCWII